MMRRTERLPLIAVPVLGRPGGKKGPDPSDAGSRRDAVWLKRYVTNPKPRIRRTMPPVKASDENLDALIAYLRSLRASK